MPIEPNHEFSPTAAHIENISALTEMQRQCVSLVVVGSSKVIAQRLGISHHTVDQHLKEACRRIGVQSRVQAAAVLAVHTARQAGAAPVPSPDPAEPPATATPSPTIHDAVQPEAVSMPQNGYPQAWGYPSQPIVPGAEAGNVAVPVEFVVTDRVQDIAVNQAIIGGVASTPVASEQTRRVRVSKGGQPLFQTLNAVVKYALIFAILAAAAVSIGDGFDSLARFINTYVRHK